MKPLRFQQAPLEIRTKYRQLPSPYHRYWIAKTGKMVSVMEYESNRRGNKIGAIKITDIKVIHVPNSGGASNNTTAVFHLYGGTRETNVTVSKRKLLKLMWD